MRIFYSNESNFAEYEYKKYLILIGAKSYSNASILFELLYLRRNLFECVNFIRIILLFAHKFIRMRQFYSNYFIIRA